jgi:hypothetical protein
MAFPIGEAINMGRGRVSGFRHVDSEYRDAVEEAFFFHGEGRGR